MGRHRVYYIDGWAEVRKCHIYGWAECVVQYLLYRRVGRRGGILHIWVGRCRVYYIDGWAEVRKCHIYR